MTFTPHQVVIKDFKILKMSLLLELLMILPGCTNLTTLSLFVPEIVSKARETSQHNLKYKTQIKLGFRVCLMCFLVVSFENKQGIHSEAK